MTDTELGELKANVSSLMENDKAKTAAMTKMAEAIQQIQITLAEANGGWKMFIGIGTAFFMAGGLVWEAVRHVWK